MTRRNPSRARRTQQRAAERRGRKQQPAEPRRLQVPDHIKALSEGGDRA
jgi:hypothetical protein